MSDDTKKISLTQADDGADHAAKIMREKIGDLGSLGAPATAGVSVNSASADQKELEERIVETLRTVYDP